MLFQLAIFELTSAIPVCLQIGNVRTIMFDIPIRSEKTKITIKLPKEYEGLPLKMERIEKNHPAYLNSNIKSDNMWPCHLSGTLPNEQLNISKTQSTEDII